MTPNASEISVVVQGPVTRYGDGDLFHTARMLDEVRRVLPGAQIVVSTWENSDLSDIVADVIIQTPDPGGITFEIGSKKPNNINRMLLSTKRGIEAANGRYILKLRSDMMPTSARFLYLWDKISKAPKYWPLFDRSVLAYPIYSLLFEDCGRRMPKPFHVSDWAFFGLASDVRALFSVPLVDEPEFSRFFDNHDAHAFDTAPLVRWRFSPEQYLFYAALRTKHPELPPLAHKQDYNPANVAASEKAIFSNFLFLDPDQWGLLHDKAEYRKEIYRFDSKCYYGLIQHGTYVIKHWQRVGRLPLGVTASGVLRQLRSRFLYSLRRVSL